MSSCFFSSTFRKATPASVIATTTPKTVKIEFQGRPRETRAIATAGPAIDPSPLMNCAKVRLRAKRPSSDTSRMIGLPATCRRVMPTPIRKMAPTSMT